MIKYSDTRHNFTLSHDVGLRAFGAQARMLVFKLYFKLTLDQLQLTELKTVEI